MSIVLALAVGSSARGLARAALLLAVCAALTGVFITAGRGQILALAVALPILLLLLRRAGVLTARALWIGAATILVTAAVVLPTVGNASVVKSPASPITPRAIDRAFDVALRNSALMAMLLPVRQGNADDG